MVWQCEVSGCQTTRKNKIKMHRFRRDTMLLRKWLLAIGRSDLEGDENVFKKCICDLHFSEQQKFASSSRNRTDLVYDAIPDCNLPEDNRSLDSAVLAQANSKSTTSDVHEDFPALATFPSSPRHRGIIFTNDESPPMVDLSEKSTNGSESSSVSADSSSNRTFQEDMDNDKIRITSNASVDEMIVRDTPDTSFTQGKNVTSNWETPRKPQDLKKQFNLLRAVKTTRKTKLTPRARKLYNVGMHLRKMGKKLFNDNMKFKRKLTYMLQVKDTVEQFPDVNFYTKNFIVSQLRQQKKHVKGRRYNFHDKVLGLSLYKRGPKTYRLLRKIFALPSREVLLQLLARVPFDVGLNEAIMQSLKSAVRKEAPLNRRCVLMFDEIFLECGLQYDSKSDTIDGFHNTGDCKKLLFADHAFVFMIRGIRRKWKQPISFYFVSKGMDSLKIKEELKTVINELQNLGLIVDATVCDQGSSNPPAINKLIAETREKLLRENREDLANSLLGFFIGDKEYEIVPIFDPPHLLKGIRNNFLLYVARFVWKNKVQKFASWEAVRKTYECDSRSETFKLLRKITDAHIYPKKMRKMKVKLASQVFSRTFAAFMRFCKRAGKDIPYGEDTAEFLLFFDQLFDSCNGVGGVGSQSSGSRRGRKRSKNLLKSGIHSHSLHLEFWKEAQSVLESIKFIKFVKGKRTETQPPSVKNWIRTIRGLRRIWFRLKKKGFNYVNTRVFDQDPLENCFGSIRANGARSNNPTPSQFRGAFKTTLLNNFMSSYSVGSNCEEDDSVGALQNIQQLVTSGKKKKRPSLQPIHKEYFNTQKGTFRLKTTPEDIMNIHSYIAGAVARSLLRTARDCDCCRANLLSRDVNVNQFHKIIELKEFSSERRSLLYPMTSFLNAFSQMTDVMDFFLPRFCLEDGISQLMRDKIKEYVDNSFLNCPEHRESIFDLFIKKFVVMYTHQWVREVNLILKGIRSYSGEDAVKKLAVDYYEKYRVHKLSINKIKEQREENA